MWHRSGSIQTTTPRERKSGKKKRKRGVLWRRHLRPRRRLSGEVEKKDGTHNNKRLLVAFAVVLRRGERKKTHHLSRMSIVTPSTFFSPYVRSRSETKTRKRGKKRKDRTAGHPRPLAGLLHSPFRFQVMRKSLLMFARGPGLQRRENGRRSGFDNTQDKKRAPLSKFSDSIRCSNEFVILK